MKSQVLHNVWCYISGEAAGDIWNWSVHFPFSTGSGEEDGEESFDDSEARRKIEDYEAKTAAAAAATRDQGDPQHQGSDSDDEEDPREDEPQGAAASPRPSHLQNGQVGAVNFGDLESLPNVLFPSGQCGLFVCSKLGVPELISSWEANSWIHAKSGGTSTSFRKCPGGQGLSILCFGQGLSILCFGQGLSILCFGQCLRPSSDADLFMSRTKYLQLSTWNVRRLNRLRTASEFGTPRPFFSPGSLGILGLETASIQTPIFSRAELNGHCPTSEFLN